MADNLRLTDVMSIPFKKRRGEKVDLNSFLAHFKTSSFTIPFMKDDKKIMVEISFPMRLLP